MIDVMKDMIKDSTNCVLGYVLSQPVEIDVVMLVAFALEYTGAFQVIRIISLVRSGFELLVYALKQSSLAGLTAGLAQRSDE
jgi:hypothetical protein